MKVLYSVNTWLAYKIAEVYYLDIHYVWCAPFFNSNSDNPPSSDPGEIYRTLAKDVIGKDKHSAKIAQNKAGILKGADINLQKGVIKEEQHQDILEIVNSAELPDFRPLIYVIPFHLVKDLAKPASIRIKANHFSKEYIVENLAREHFDIIEVLNA